MWQTLKVRVNQSHSDQMMENLYSIQNHGSYEGFQWFQFKKEIKKRPLTFIALAYCLMIFYFS
jgi:hypothetical protein